MARLGRGFPNNPALRAIPTASVAYSATGPGGASSSSPVTFTDTVPADANCTLIWVSNLSTVANPTVSASIGSTGATLQSSILADTITGQFLYLRCFSVFNPPTGSQTITFTTTNPLGNVFNTVHYRNVSALGSAVTLGQQTGQPSIAATTSLRAVYAHAFTYLGVNAGDTFTGYSQTQRYLAPQVSGSNYPMIVGDASGNNSTVTFSATRTTTTHNWGGMIMPLIPLPR